MGFKTSRRNNILWGLYDEMFQLSDVEFKIIVDFLKSQPYEYNFKYNQKSFLLVHYLRYKEVEGSESKIADEFWRGPFPYLNHKYYYDYILFGHDPVAKWHRNSYVDFNYREILSYIDERGIHYYNLDLVETDILGILRLDDMEEFYVTSRTENRNDRYRIPKQDVKDRKTKISILPIKEGREKYVTVYKDFCWEFDSCFYYDEKKSIIKFTPCSDPYRLKHKGNIEEIVEEVKAIKTNKYIPLLQSENPHTEKDILLELSETDDIKILKNLARDEGAPQEILLKLSKKEETYLDVAKNQSTSSDILSIMCDIYDKTSFLRAVLHNKNVNDSVKKKVADKKANNRYLKLTHEKVL